MTFNRLSFVFGMIAGVGVSVCVAVLLGADTTTAQDEICPIPPTDSVCAVVLPEGKVVYAIEGYKEKAIRKADLLAEAAKKKAIVSGERYNPADRQIVVFKTAEELVSKVPFQQIEGVSVLVKGRVCGEDVPGSDTHCQGDSSYGYRTVYYDHKRCKQGKKNDECWDNYNASIGSYTTFKSKSDCENGVTPTTTETLKGVACD